MFHEKLQNAFKQSGLTQSKLAEKVGVTQPAVSQWLSGERTPDGYFVIMLASALDVEPLSFYCEVDKRKKIESIRSLRDKIYGIFQDYERMQLKVDFICRIVKENPEVFSATCPELYLDDAINKLRELGDKGKLK